MMQKPFKAIFKEFFGQSITSKKDFEGDVKYHLGASANREFDKNLVHITWLALNNESKKFVDDWPMKIDWSNTGVWGLAYTHPNFRKNGFYQYTHKQIQKFLLSKNIKFNRFTIKKRNIPSISAMSKFKPKNIAKGYSFHLLKFKFRLSIPINIK